MHTVTRTNVLMAVAVVSSTAISTPIAKAVTLPADILFLVDMTDSMAGDIAEVKTRIGDFNATMVANNIDARFGLVTFGNDRVGFTFDFAPEEALIQDLTDLATFSQALQNLSLGRFDVERGSVAVSVALNQASFRPGSVINLILITDEDDDSASFQFDEANTMLTQHGALFNFIGIPGGGNTDSRYNLLAANHGGRAFSIDEFRTTPGPFFERFIDTKVQEILASAPSPAPPAPEPATVVLATMSLTALVVGVRRRRIARPHTSTSSANTLHSTDATQTPARP